ncbi:hypothetical protein ERC79_12055 [Rhodococcus sp. ABRD24]|uniref:GAP family protein n=1 Tax=Rhodococcus sp. ABRD24 TaxID=2507582 RepID=UPI0010406FE7|nr:GAP family protein [Rhodococcus sp. ABRD24]QBJ96618.1 hypothetical protein ERC79_12055 [Rhodococcus sp. ABRD24]
MESTVAHLVPLGIGMIISPIPLAAIIAIVLSARARTNAMTFTAVAIAGSAVITIVTALTSRSDLDATGAAHPTQVVFASVFGSAFLVMAYLSWRSRPKNGAAAVMPSWMAQIDSMTAGRVAVLSLLLTVPNAKSLPIELKAGTLIGEAHLAVPQLILLGFGFAVLGGLGLIVLTILAAVPSKRVTAALGIVKDELVRHNAAIMTVLFLMLAALQVSHVISALNA